MALAYKLRLRRTVSEKLGKAKNLCYNKVVCLVKILIV